MYEIGNNLYEIDCYSRFTVEDHIVLSLYYIYKYQRNIDIFSPEILFYEELIIEYNKFIQQESNKEKLCHFIFNQNRNYIEECIDKFNKEPWIYSKPVIWSDRSKGQYYIDNLTESHRFEIYVESLFKNRGLDIGLYYGKDEQYSGESELGIEIKNDKESLRTGNIYIEYKERLYNNGIWIDSGILKADNTIYWAIGNYEFIFFIKKSVLKDVMNNKYFAINPKMVSAKRGTSKGYIISIYDAKKISESIEEVIKNISHSFF